MHQIVSLSQYSPFEEMSVKIVLAIPIEDSPIDCSVATHNAGIAYMVLMLCSERSTTDISTADVQHLRTLINPD